MAIIHVDESTVGAPNSGRISGTAGDLYAMLKYAAPLNGWAVEYDDAVNFRCVLRPGTGNRFRLYVNDNATDSGSAALCLIRGCENASGTTTSDLVDPFPLVSQVANGLSNWHKSSAVSATAREFDIWVGETFIIYSCNYNGNTNVWTFDYFGDFAPALAGDSYNTICTVRNSSTVGGASLWSSGMLSTSSNGSPLMYLCRTYDGTVKSPRSGIPGKYGQSNLGLVNGSLPTMLSGPTSGIDTELCTLYDSGDNSGSVSSSLALPIRGWLPNVLSPQHGGRGAVNTRHVYTESPYMATGQVITAANTVSSGCIVIQTSDDWVPPA